MGEKEEAVLRRKLAERRKTIDRQTEIIRKLRAQLAKMQPPEGQQPTCSRCRQPAAGDG